jgi:hypothetical protein
LPRLYYASSNYQKKGGRFRVQGSGFKVQGSRFRVRDTGPEAGWSRERERFQVSGFRPEVVHTGFVLLPET